MIEKPNSLTKKIARITPEEPPMVWLSSWPSARNSAGGSAIGRRAKVVVNKAEGKFASAHDLRRSFGTRWASKVKPATLQLLMRHKSIETTLKYYVAQDADDVADELWREHSSRSKPKRRRRRNRRRKR